MSPTDPKQPMVTFDGKNYSTWATSMFGILSFYQCVGIVVGTIPYIEDFKEDSSGKTELDSDGKGTYLPTGEKLDPNLPIRTKRPKYEADGKDEAEKKANRELSLASQAKYDEKNDKALGYMTMSMQHSYHHILEGETRAYIIWDKMKELYGKVGLVSGFSSFQSLFNYRCDGSKPIRPQIAHMENLRHKVTQSGITISDMWFSLIILNSLPSSYQMLGTTILSMRTAMTDLVPVDIIAKIEEEETHRRSNKAGSDAQIHRISNTKTLTLRCTREGCSRPEGSHTTENHWENGKRPSASGSGSSSGGNRGKGKPGGNNRNRNNGKSSGSRQPKVNTIRFDDLELNSALAANTISSTAYTKSDTIAYITQWMWDTGCTRHVSNNINDFTKYKPFLEPGKAKIGDRSEIPILGHGEVKLHHTNSKGEKVEIVLEQVLYVPKASG